MHLLYVARCCIQERDVGSGSLFEVCGGLGVVLSEWDVGVVSFSFALKTDFLSRDARRGF